MKRIAGLLAITALCVSATACAKADSSSSSNDQKRPTFILFVGAGSDSDKIAMGRIEKKFGALVTLMDAKVVNSDMARPYNLVIVSPSANPNQIANKFLYSPIPVVYEIGTPLPFLGMTADDPSAFGTAEGKSIQIKDDKSELAAGLKGAVDVYNQSAQLGFGIPGKEATVVATMPDDPKKATIFAYDKGAKTEHGTPAAAREVFYYLQSGNEIYQTESGWKLFDAAIQWAMNGQQSK